MSLLVENVLDSRTFLLKFPELDVSLHCIIDYN